MYQQNDGLWYFRYKDENGKWRTYSTHTRDESVAMELENHFKLTKDLLRNPKTIEDLISIFSLTSFKIKKWHINLFTC